MCIFCAETVKICATASERKCAADIFYVEDCVAASGNISMFFNERGAASEKILRKNMQLLLRIMST